MSLSNLLKEKKKKADEYFAPVADKVRVRDVARELPGTIGDMFSGTKSVVTKAPKIIGEGLAYATSRNVRDQYKAGNLDILPTISSTTPRKMLADTAKSVLEIAPVGKIKATARFLAAPSLSKRLAGGAGLGYAYDVADRMSKDEKVTKDTFKPGVGTVAGGALAGLMRPTAKIAKQGIDDTVQFGKTAVNLAKQDIKTLKNPAPVVKKVEYLKDGKWQTVTDVTNEVSERLFPGNERLFEKDAQELAHINTRNKPARVVETVLPKKYGFANFLKESIPQPGLSIKDVSKKKSAEIIALKNARAREIVEKQRQLQRSGAQTAEEGFVPPQSVKAPENAKSSVSGVKKYFKNAYKVYDGQSPQKVVANLPESVSEKTGLPIDVTVKKAFFDKMAERHPEIDRKKLFDFVKTLNIPDSIYQLSDKEKLNFFRKLEGEVMNVVSAGKDAALPQTNVITSFNVNPNNASRKKYVEKLKNTSEKVFDRDSGGTRQSPSSNILSEVPGTGASKSPGLRNPSTEIVAEKSLKVNAPESPTEKFSRELDGTSNPLGKPASVEMPQNIRVIKENVDNGILVGPKNFAKLRQWEERQMAKPTASSAESLPATQPYNKYQQAEFDKKQTRVKDLSEVINAPGILRAMGYTKAEAKKLGVEETKIIAKLGQLGYPKDDPILRDVRSETVTKILENKISYKTLKEYYTRKHELDTKILDGINPNTLKDISPLQTGTRDVYRNFETVFGDGRYNDPTFQKVKKELLDPFDASKGEFIAEQQKQLAELDDKIVSGLGIKKGSKLSAAVQMFGEGKMSLDQAKEQFPNDWQKIVEADKWFRNMYDTMLDETNRVREYYFPTHPLFPESTKVIPKRKNYYRHFQEMADGFKGLLNIFDTPANIDPSLAVSSEFTKPRAKWLSFAQQRKGDQTENDAVGGFLDYIKANAYAKHIDPHIQRFRGVDAELKSKAPRGEFFDDTRIGLAEELSKKIDPFQEIADIADSSKIKNILIDKGLQYRDALRMAKDLSEIKDAAAVKEYLGKNLTPEGMGEFNARAKAEDSGNKLNNFLKFLDNFANDLAGKTNPLDRPIQDNFLGRQAFRAINWANSRVKANVILGNMSSAIAQFFGIPNGVANAGARNSAKAIGSSLIGTLKDDVPSSQSVFLNERYFNGYDKFEPGVVANTKRFAVWITSIGDKIGTTFTWNAQYQKALAKGVADPIKYADDWTRRMVAGRGIGEVPIMQKSKLVQIVAPFQLEVANQWRVFGDWAKNDPGKLAVAKKLIEYSVTVWVMNRVAKELRGSDVSFDPMQAMIDAYGSFQNADGIGEGSLLAGGRLVGEGLSNLPGGSTAAAFYPEFGAKDILGTGINLPTREKLFGDKDPTRFGNGLMAGRGFLEPQYLLAPPFGGRQIKNMYDGGKTLLKGYAETAAGKVMTPVESSPYNMAKGLLFGKNALQEVQDYREADSNPLGDKQSATFKLLGPKTEEGKAFFGSAMNNRALNRAKEALKSGKSAADIDLDGMDEAEKYVSLLGYENLLSVPEGKSVEAVKAVKKREQSLVKMLEDENIPGPVKNQIIEKSGFTKNQAEWLVIKSLSTNSEEAPFIAKKLESATKEEIAEAVSKGWLTTGITNEMAKQGFITWDEKKGLDEYIKKKTGVKAAAKKKKVEPMSVSEKYFFDTIVPKSRTFRIPKITQAGSVQSKKYRFSKPKFNWQKVRV